MELLSSFILNDKDLVIINEWRDLLLAEAERKRIPLALRTSYVNEKVYHWIQRRVINNPDEYNLLLGIFPMTNWESVCYHDWKIAVVLCAYVNFHTFESAIRRVKEPDFMSAFLRAHSKDREAERTRMKLLRNDVDVLYLGRPIIELFSSFLEDHVV
jgi:hypothetical protein